MIRVVNVRAMNDPTQRAGVIYVGRRWAGWPAHPLANPFRAGYRMTSAGCLVEYRAWLLGRETLGEDLAALWEATDRGAKPLGCWCVNSTAGDGQPCVCHAQVLAAMLLERFGPGSELPKERFAK